MDDAQPDGGSESQRQLDELSARVAANRADIDALQSRAEAAGQRADVSDARADASDARADASAARADASEARAGARDARADVDRRMIAELQADGLLGRQQVAHLEVALRSSRKIGAAIGIVMAVRLVDEEDAFEILKSASSRANRRLRDIADEVVRSGDVSGLPDVGAPGAPSASQADPGLPSHQGLGS